MFNTDPIKQLEANLRRSGDKYIERRELELKLLREDALMSDFKVLEIWGHRLKGTAKTYGFEDLGLLGAELEEAANSGDTARTAALLAGVERYLTAVKKRNLRAEI